MVFSFPIIAGIIAAAAHVVSGPDHLAAVAPFAVNGRNKPWKIGLSWGLGHLFGMLVIGLLFTFIKDLPPVEHISSYGEQLVGIVLIGIGIWAILRLYKEKKHLTHHHHTHTFAEPSSGVSSGTIATFSVGSLHGVAGIAHFVLFLPVLGFESRGESVAYISGFAIGTVLTMIVFTFFLGYLGKIAGKYHIENAQSKLRLMAGLAAVIVGIYWIFTV